MVDSGNQIPILIAAEGIPMMHYRIPAAVYEGMNELEEKEEQLPFWNRSGGRKAGVVVRSKWFSLIPMNELVEELFDPSTTPALRATPPIPGGELLPGVFRQFTPTLLGS
jgi:hypothetical protein